VSKLEASLFPHRHLALTFNTRNRHPNIIGLYAWFKRHGTVTQFGMVIELLPHGDLMELYKEKRGRKFELKQGIKILAGAAKGLAYMHSRPIPVIHRDIKSSNIMVAGNTGKLGDCGESRRIDMNATMTQVGTPLWAAVR
jgi:serine/threonine protein kinase